MKNIRERAIREEKKAEYNSNLREDSRHSTKIEIQDGILIDILGDSDLGSIESGENDVSGGSWAKKI